MAKPHEGIGGARDLRVVRARQFDQEVRAPGRHVAHQVEGAQSRSTEQLADLIASTSHERTGG